MSLMIKIGIALSAVSTPISFYLFNFIQHVALHNLGSRPRQSCCFRDASSMVRSGAPVACRGCLACDLMPNFSAGRQARLYGIEIIPSSNPWIDVR